MEIKILKWFFKYLAISVRMKMRIKKTLNMKFLILKPTHSCVNKPSSNRILLEKLTLDQEIASKPNVVVSVDRIIPCMGIKFTTQCPRFVLQLNILVF